MEGQTIDSRYVILEKVGAGGMADVYRARDNETGEEVAVKLMHADLLSDPEFVRRFEREAVAQSMLSHQNIVRTLGHGQDGDLPYIVMEYVEGITLKDFIKNRAPMQQKMLTRIARQILAALGHAHERGVIHRDIKPQNVLMGRGNILKVTDFGLAKAASSATITMTGSNVLGSVHYFSPEQARGIASDARSDLYSLGIILYEMATGELPYQGDTPVTVALKHLQEVPVWPHLVADVPPALEGIILKAILKDPDQRYQNAAQMAQDLSRALADPTVDLVKFPKDLYVAKDYDDENRIGESFEPEQIERNIPRTRAPKSGKTQDVAIQRSIHPGSQQRPQTRVPQTEPHIQQPHTVTREPEPELRQGFNKKLFFIGVATLICLVVALALVLVLVNSKEKQYMPDVLGFSEIKATTELDNRGLTATVEKIFDDEVAEGKVISQYPDADTELTKKNINEISLVISLGPEEIDMPNVVGMSYDQAAEVFAREGLNIGVINYEVDSSKAKDTVVRQLPLANEPVSVNEYVQLWLSRP